MMNSRCSTSYSKLHEEASVEAGQTTGEVKALARLVKRCLDDEVVIKKEAEKSSRELGEKIRLLETSTQARIEALERHIEEKDQEMERRMQERLEQIEEQMQIRLILALASRDRGEVEDPKGRGPTDEALQKGDRLGDQLTRLEELLRQVLERLDVGMTTKEATASAHEGMTLALTQLQSLFPHLQKLIIRPPSSRSSDAQKAAKVLFGQTQSLVQVMSEQLDVACSSLRSRSIETANAAGDVWVKDQQVAENVAPSIEKMAQEIQLQGYQMQDRLQRMRIELSR